MKWFSPPTSDESSDETDEILSPKQNRNSFKPRSCYGQTQICENIYSKTYKKRQSYERKRDQVGIANNSTVKVKSLHLGTKKTIGRSISDVKSTKGRPKKTCESLAIAKQLLEKAKGEKRFQLQKKEIQESGRSPVSRFGRTVKKKVLDYDDFTGGHKKRKQESDGKLPPVKAFKDEDGARQLIQSGW